MDINCEHLVHELAELSREMGWYRSKVASDNVHGQKVHIHPLKRRLQRTELIEHDTQRPDVALE